jgi:site-specific recombinase XerD
MTATIKDLYDFIDTAHRNRKYPLNTAQGLRAAVKLFDAELNDEERKSVDTVKNSLEQIYQSIFTKNKMTASSLTTYKSRFLKVINDYEKYGTDPTKMTNWNPKVVVRSKRLTQKPDVAGKTNQDVDEGLNGYNEVIPNNMHKIELALRSDAKFVLIIPRDLKLTEVTTLNAILTSLIVDGGGSDSSGIQEASAK